MPQKVSPGLNTLNDVTYRKPPVVETSLGVEFGSITGWNTHVFGLLLARLGDRFPKFETAPPIMASSAGLGFSVSMGAVAPRIRAFYSNPERNRLLQVQDDLFFLNWRKTPNQQYPRYQELLAEYLFEWAGYQQFLVETNLILGPISRYQITYINVIDRDDKAILGLSDIFVGWRTIPGRVGSAIQSASISLESRIGDVDLTYVVQPAIQTVESKRVYQFVLTCSTRRVDSKGVNLEREMNHLHGALIESFEEVSSLRAKALWERVE
jgi:uncharacterized protein (TIGR04255 family)